MTSITCGNCKQTHSTVEAVKACYASGRGNNIVTRMADAGLPTPSRYQGPREIHIPLSEIIGTPNDGAFIRSGGRSSGRPARPARRSFTAADSGIYKADEDVFKVYKALNGDHMLVKQMVLEDGVVSWNYMGGAGRCLPQDAHRVTLEEAKQFGAIYGVCMVCGRTLTNEVSIEAGIGPICAGRL